MPLPLSGCPPAHSDEVTKSKFRAQRPLEQVSPASSPHPTHAWDLTGSEGSEDGYAQN